MVCADVLCTFYVKAFWQTPMRPVKWTLWPRAAPIWVEAVLLQSLPGYLSHLHHARSASLKELAGVFGSQGMTRARSIDLPLHPPMPGPVALTPNTASTGRLLISNGSAKKSRWRLANMNSDWNVLVTHVDPSREVAVPLPAASSAGDTAQANELKPKWITRPASTDERHLSGMALRSTAAA